MRWAHLFVLLKCRVAGTNRHAEATCWGSAREPGAGQESWALSACSLGELTASLSSPVTCQEEGAFRQRFSRSSWGPGKCPGPSHGSGGKPNRVNTYGPLPPFQTWKLCINQVLRKIDFKDVKTTRWATFHVLYLQKGKVKRPIIFFSWSNTMVAGARILESVQPSSLLSRAVWPWASLLPSFWLSCLICSMSAIVRAAEDSCED